MTYTLFLFQIISFQKYFYVSLGNIFYCFFLWRPLCCGGPWATAQYAPPLKSGPAKFAVLAVRELRFQRFSESIINSEITTLTINCAN